MTDRKSALEALDLIADEILHGEGDVCQQILIAYLATIRDALAAPTEQQEFTDRKAALEALNRITSNLRWIDSHEYLGDIDLVRAALDAPTDAALHQAHDEIRALRSRLAPTDAERKECARRLQFIADHPGDVIVEEIEEVCAHAARLLRAATAAKPGDAQPVATLRVERAKNGRLQNWLDGDWHRNLPVGEYPLYYAAPPVAVPQDANGIADAIEHYWRHHFSDNVDMHPLAAACEFLRTAAPSSTGGEETVAEPPSKA